MTLKEYIKEYEITRGKALKYFLLGKEDELFLTAEDDDIRNLFKSQKKEFRSIMYRFVYLMAVIVLFLSIWNTDLIIFFFILALKPIAHLANLESKRKKKNIYLYQLYNR
ncbi:MAG TPA: hypothetical protein VFF21_00180 [Flavobacteriaceae bacterium]|nr:hypothetical protein [Flavobacteriaceae bacterium]